ncbi:MAG: helix-turn-helix transcriptional regulator [Anaerolineae bacterium]|nr:helix-turn-helix transcriptional regulator [Anaerolineae bacterium]
MGLLQKEVAMKIGVTESTITNWELNHNFPKLRCMPASTA